MITMDPINVRKTIDILFPEDYSFVEIARKIACEAFEFFSGLWQGVCEFYNLHRQDIIETLHDLTTCPQALQSEHAHLDRRWNIEPTPF